MEVLHRNPVVRFVHNTDIVTVDVNLGSSVTRAEIRFVISPSLNNRMKLLVLLGQVSIGMLHNKSLSGVHLRDDGLSLENAKLLFGVLDGRLNFALVGEISVGVESVPGSSDGVLSEVVAGHSVSVSQQLSVQIQSKSLVCGHFEIDVWVVF